ncbi:MBL fold metallo-hydrolase [Salinicola sp. V024]|uniref:MBL fold metallo-hydrolase n=1 Tax=Salinicola sp. V024 TaxID=3459609 RepID=UPI00404422D4
MTTAIHIGRFKMTWLLGGVFPFTADFMPAVASAQGQRNFAAAGLPIEGPSFEPFHAFAIEWDDHLWLLDAGPGLEEGPDRGEVLNELRALGHAPEDVDAIVITHLHKDHTGGLLTAEGKAIYPNATIYVGETEMAFWTNPDHVPAANPRDHEVALLMQAQYQGRIEVLADDAVIRPGISFVPLPGHSPGHNGVLLEDGDARLLMWSDLMHSAAQQFNNPEWSVVVDLDPERAIETRLALLERLAEEETLVAGSHTQGVGKVRRHASAYKLVPAEGGVFERSQ